jgi:hypothetical protein
MARARQSRDCPSGNIGTDSTSKLIPDEGFQHPKKSERHRQKIKNIVPAQRERISRIRHTCGTIKTMGCGHKLAK